MADRFPQEVLDQILDRINIAELIASYIPLKKSGRNFKALCPFHYEKTASFMVNSDKGIYHCFGCSAGGNAFNFLMQYEHLEFREAVEVLARKTGVNLPVVKYDDAKISLEQEIYQSHELAAEFYHRNLLKDPRAKGARQYLTQRKISPQTAKAFKLGFACDEWDNLLNYLRDNKIPLQVIEKSGLVVAKESGGFYDRFRNRIMFPIFDAKSRFIAFGARTLEEKSEGAKYINSPETPIYIKGNNLYGLNFAREAIRQNDAVLVVEGYLDMITPFQAGVNNIVATSGTALTENQIRLLKRYTKNIVVVFDADSAGQMAALRSLDLFIEEDVFVKVAVLPSGYDPDSLVRDKGIEALKAVIDNSLSLFDYKISLLLKSFNPKSIEGKSKIAHEMLATVNKFKDEILKTEYLKKLSQFLNISERALQQEAKKDFSNVASNRVSPESAAISQVQNKPVVEKMILTLLIKDNTMVAAVKKELKLDDFQDSQIRQILAAIFEFDNAGKEFVPHQLMNFFADDNFIHQLISELVFSEDHYCIDGLDLNDREKCLSECLRRMKSQQINCRKQSLREQILAAQNKKDDQMLAQLLGEYNELIHTKAREPAL